MFTTAFVMSSTAFSIGNRALRAKRRTFSKDLIAALDDVKSNFGLTKEAFNEKKDYFESAWEEIVTSTEDCVNLIDDREDEGVNRLRN